ncbi:MAG: S8 family serine peptidase [Bacteriovoracaceae bacterium]
MIKILLLIFIFSTSILADEFVKGELLVKMKSKSSSVKVKLRSGKDMSEAIEEYERNPNVEYAQPNYIYHLQSTTPNDPKFSEAWALKNSAQSITGATYSTNNPGSSGKDMNLINAWDLNTNCNSIIVAVLDSGVNYNHEDLSANMWDGTNCRDQNNLFLGSCNFGYDFVDSDKTPMDLNGHGTHIAGTIGAVGNNSIGGVGVCWNVKIMAVRVANVVGELTTASVINGINFARYNGAKVINMSLGGTGTEDTAYKTAVTNAINDGIVVVVSAGNDGANNDTTPMWPCSFNLSGIVCVAAVDQAYSLATFSNYGATSVDVGAPGTNIYNSTNGTWSSIQTDNFSTGWTQTPTTTVWKYVAAGSGSSCVAPSYPALLTLPNNWCADGTYANNLDQRIWKNFGSTPGNYDAAKFEFEIFFDLQKNNDYLGIARWNVNSEPYAASSSSLAASLSELGTSGTATTVEYDLDPCKGQSNCSIGFIFQSNSSVVDNGVALFNFVIKGLTLSTNNYKSLNGTSMAAPHVAGLAALIRAFNPNYTVTDTVNAIINGGDSVTSLSGKTVSGKVVDAYGSLTYINTPTGVTATVQ